MAPLALFTRRERPPAAEAFPSHWRPMRAALVLACLALSLSALAGTGILGLGAPVNAAAAQYGAAPKASTDDCPATTPDGQLIPASQVAQLYVSADGVTMLAAATPGVPSACLALSPIPQPTAGVPTGPGKVILISRRQQWLWAYQDGKLLFASPIATGQPDLPTPLGTFPVMRKTSNTMFYSPWPKGSPYYYAPLHIDYALLFKSGGFFIHDAPWRYDFGPGADDAHTLPDGATETGSHGCVDVPVEAGQWLYSWANAHTHIVIVDDSRAHTTSPAEQQAA